MKAITFAEYGGPDVLPFVEVDAPHAGAGQVRIAVRAAGVNGIDWKIRAGYLREQMPLSLPAGTGIDAAGVVARLYAGGAFRIPVENTSPLAATAAAHTASAAGHVAGKLVVTIP